MRLFGLFFECKPTRKREASFLFDQNASELLSSNGWIALDLLNETASGFFSCIWSKSFASIAGKVLREEHDLTSSDSAIFTASLVVCPRTKTAVFADSLAFGSLALSARFDRAFLGLLGTEQRQYVAEISSHCGPSHCQLHGRMLVEDDGRADEKQQGQVIPA